MVQWLSRFKQGFSKSASKLTQNLSGLWAGRKPFLAVRDDIEALLLEGNFGPHFTQRFLEALAQKKWKDLSAEEVKELLAEEIQKVLAPCCRALPMPPNDATPWTCLLLGVNGSGKTTTAGKMAALWHASGKRVLLVGADLFRAAADLQAEAWAQRSGVTFFGGTAHKDAAALAFDACSKAQEDNFDAVLLDTAGRLHTQKNLMDELSKVVRVIKKQNAHAPHQVLLVVDGTVGQNAIAQVQQFGQVAPLTGLIITKVDGTARAGVVVQLVEQFHIPIVGLGLGESVQDLAPADAALMARTLVGLT